MGLLPWLQAQGYRCHWTSTDPSSCSRSWPTAWDRDRACEWGAVLATLRITAARFRYRDLFVPDSQVHCLRGPDHSDGQKHVVADFGSLERDDRQTLIRTTVNIPFDGNYKNVARTCPVPTWPQYTTLAPMQLRSSLAAVNSSSAPPTMNVSLAELAAPTPGNETLSSRGAQWF